MTELKKSMTESDASENNGAAATEVTIDLEILRSSDFVDSIDYRHIVGEAQNNSAQPVQNIFLNVYSLGKAFDARKVDAIIWAWLCSKT